MDLQVFYNFFKKNIFLLLVVVVAAVPSLAWKGDAGIPVNLGTDIGFHAYSVWFAQHQITSGKLDFGFDFFTNTVFSRTYPPFYHFLGGVVSIFAGVWGSISIMVFVSYALLSFGVFFLSRSLGLEDRFAFLAALAAAFSFPLAVEARLWGSVTRVFTYSLLPWLLLSIEKISQNETGGGKFFACFVVVSAVSILSHPLTAAYFLLISLAWLASKKFFEKSLRLSKTGLELTKGFAIAILLSSFFLLPLFFEKSETHLTRYSTPQQNFPDAQNILTRFFTRSFDLEKGHSLYLGFNLALLAVFSLSSIKENARLKQLSVLLFLFLLITLFPSVLHSLNQTDSRPAFFASFFLALVAAFGAKELEKKTFFLTAPQIPVFAFVLVAAAVVSLDLNPLSIPAPAYSFPVHPVISYYYSTLDYHGGGGRFLTLNRPLQDDVLLVSLTKNSTTLYDPPERLNPEYSSFLSGLSFSEDQRVLSSKTFLLNVRLILIQQQNNVLIYEAGGTPGFVGKGILLDFTEVSSAESFFEKLASSERFQPSSAVFILPKAEPSKPDFSFDEANSSVLIEGFASSFSTSPLQVELDERKNEIRFIPDDGGFAFVSVMHYPLWKAYSGGRELKVLQSGGGLVAIEGVEKGKQVVMRFEKPWYDYAGMLVSLAGLIALAFVYSKHRLVKRFF